VFNTLLSMMSVTRTTPSARRAFIAIVGVQALPDVF